MDGLTATYFVLFAAGAGLLVVSWLTALGKSPGHGLHHGHVHGHGAGHGAGHAVVTHGVVARLLIPLVNLSALCALACVGGGVGYLMRRAGVAALPSLFGAVPAGLGAAYATAGLLGWLARGTRYAPTVEPTSVVGTVIAAISNRGTGEVVYQIGGARHTLPARSASGRAIPEGAEVIVLGIEEGIARVSPANEGIGEERT
jgi:hypothetical protein